MSKLYLNTTIALADGNRIPSLGLGTWRSDKGLVESAVYSAIMSGYRHIDGAHVYENEQEVGRGVHRAIKDAQIKREHLFIVSKLWNTWHDPALVETACRKSLANFGLDYLDLYLIHWPISFKHSGDTLWSKDENGHFFVVDFPLLDTWRAMESLVKKGLVKSIGLSNCTIEQVQYIVQNAKIKPVTNQVEVHPYFNQAKLQHFCNSHGIVLTAYCPLGNLDPTSDKPTPLKHIIIANLSKKYNKSPAQILLRWNLQLGNIIVPKSVTESRILENANLYDFELSSDDINAISDIEKSTRIRFCNPPFNAGGNAFFVD